MIGIKDQCFGVEVELTGITRQQAAQTLANYFGTRARHIRGGYDTWTVSDTEGKEWKLMSDSSIKAERKENGSPNFRNASVRCATPEGKSTTAVVCMFM